ncbi:MspA family porin [Nocardia sp. NPDC019395]|uniref:MspA family porin n=1 Tax=Nocardia sp. NPDC019395 TaxID=3154686 RepID=UPI0033EF22E9
MTNHVPSAAESASARPHRLRNLTGLGCAAITVIGLLSAGAAQADTFVPLPDGRETGPGVTLTRVGEHATVSPSMAANGVGRVAWVTGTVAAEVTDAPRVERPGPYSSPGNGNGTNNSSTHGASQVNAGYIIGCQVSVGDKAITAGMSANVGTTSAGVSGSVGVQLGPGEVKLVQVGFKDILEPGRYAVGYRDFGIDLQGCGGYAQARSYAVVEIIGNNYSKTVLYGAPFSIG